MEKDTKIDVKAKQKTTQELMTYIAGVINDSVPRDEVLRLQNNGTPHNEALRRVMRSVSAKDSGNKLPESERSIIAVVAELGTFAEASNAVDSIGASGKRTTTLDHTTKRLKSEYIIPFNHAVKDLIDAHPNEGIDSMAAALTYLYSVYYSHDNSIDPKDLAHQPKPTENDVMYQIKERLNGMRHEVAAWTMLDLAGFEIDDDVSIDEDKSGLDIVVKDNGQPIYIDIKSTERSALDARPKTGIRTVYTGLTPRDFTGQDGNGRDCLGVPYDTAINKCDSFAEAVRQNRPIPRSTRGIGKAASGDI